MVATFDILLINGRMRWHMSCPKLSLNALYFDRRRGFSSGRFFSLRFRMNNVLLQKLLARHNIVSGTRYGKPNLSLAGHAITQKGKIYHTHPLQIKSNTRPKVSENVYRYLYIHYIKLYTSVFSSATAFYVHAEKNSELDTLLCIYIHDHLVKPTRMDLQNQTLAEKRGRGRRRKTNTNKIQVFQYVYVYEYVSIYMYNV